ncbi:Transient-receptor-potential-like protein [Holothuria leucospilota]|uniref:Transient-receptor-potential-like protein n=1 Tax=Holothuria leucospilota TaxID=206669 RepID=A0A9Q1BQG8_HOLLE|nr:Transient-receptor-potential-like protein [Holothuria leucospilota]
MLQSHPNFTQQIEDVVDGTEDLLCDLLSQCKSRREIQAFLQISATPKMSDKSRKHRMVTTHQHEDSSLPPGLEQAISMGFKKLVAHPFSQMIVTECVFNGPVNWDDMCPATFILVSILVIIFSPVLCLSYSLCPVRKLVEFMQTPYVRVLNSFSSHLFFLFFLLMTAINIDYIDAECPDVGISNSQYYTCSEVTTLLWPIYGRAVLIGIVVCGQALWLSSSCYKIGLSSISGHKWQWVVITQTLLFAMSLVAYIVSLLQVETYSLPSDGESAAVLLLNRKPYNHTVFVSVGETLYQPSRGYWNFFDAQIVAEVTFSLANILTVQRLLHTCIFFEGIGPLIISIGRMLSGIMKFAVIALLILMSFALGFTQLFAPYVDLQPCDSSKMSEDALKHCGDASMFSSVRQSLNTLFWAIFGEFHIANMELPTSLSIVQYTGQILHAIYIIMTSIILLNMLVAAMLTTYDSIQGNVHTEWKFSRTNMMLEYCGHRSNVPVPFNLFPSVRVIFGFLSAIYRKIVALLINCGIKVPEKTKKNTYFKWKRKSADGVSAQRGGRIKFKERHQVIQTIVERYKHMHWQTSPPSRDLLHPRTDSDRLRSTQSVTSFSAIPGADSRLNSVARPRESEVFSPTATEPTISKAPSIETVPSLSKASSVETMPFVRGASSLRSLPSYTSRLPSEPRNGNDSSRPVVRPHRGAIRKKYRPGSVSLV